jgi:hypothetical protein
MAIAVALTSASVALGFGKHMGDVDMANMATISLNSNIASTFSILSAVLSKTSFAVTLLRITEGYTKICVWIIIAVMNASMWVCALFTWIKCNPPRKTWDYTVPGTCWDTSIMTAYSIFSAGASAPEGLLPPRHSLLTDIPRLAISGLGDLALSLLPWKVLFNLQIKRKEKIGVGFAMSMGVL